MEKKIIVTGDGSHSISIPAIGETYHSHHGAIGESAHVFIRTGLLPFIESGNRSPVRILEIGFGTGLNALLTYIEAARLQQAVQYTTIEPFPLLPEEAASLNYCSQLKRPDLQKIFEEMHAAVWDTVMPLGNYFTFYKSAVSLLDHTPGENIDLVYFDAFSPTSQPELWTQAVFETLFCSMAPGGVLVTYCSKSIVRQVMKAAGFTIQKLQGPWGKREMVKAMKMH